MDSLRTLFSPRRPDAVFVPILPPSTHNHDPLFGKELCDLLNSLEVGFPRFVRVSKEKSLRWKGKKTETIGKAAAAA
jgi:hypothetical protein